MQVAAVVDMGLRRARSSSGSRTTWSVIEVRVPVNTAPLVGEVSLVRLTAVVEAGRHVQLERHLARARNGPSARGGAGRSRRAAVIGMKSTTSPTPSSVMKRVTRIAVSGKYSCLLVKTRRAGGSGSGRPVSWSSSAPKMLGESNRGAQNQSIDAVRRHQRRGLEVADQAMVCDEWVVVHVASSLLVARARSGPMGAVRRGGAPFLRTDPRIPARHPARVMPAPVRRARLVSEPGIEDVARTDEEHASVRLGRCAASTARSEARRDGAERVTMSPAFLESVSWPSMAVGLADNRDIRSPTVPT